MAQTILKYSSARLGSGLGPLPSRNIVPQDDVTGLLEGGGEYGIVIAGSFKFVYLAEQSTAERMEPSPLQLLQRLLAELLSGVGKVASKAITRAPPALSWFTSRA